jgi:Cohesin domain
MCTDFRILLAVTWVALAGRPAAMAQGAFVAKIPGASIQSSVTLSTSDGNGSPGQTVEIPINMACNGPDDPVSFQLDLRFDEQKLTFASARVGTELSSANKSLSSNVVATGEVRLSTSGMPFTTISDGLVAYASFTLKPGFLSGSTTVAPLNCVGSRANGSALATGCTGSIIKTFGCDLNQDGSTNIADVQLMLNETLGMISAVHDLNHDGMVNVADVQKLINAALGQGCPY